MALYSIQYSISYYMGWCSAAFQEVHHDTNYTDPDPSAALVEEQQKEKSLQEFCSAAVVGNIFYKEASANKDVQRTTPLLPNQQHHLFVVCVKSLVFQFMLSLVTLFTQQAAVMTLSDHTSQSTDQDVINKPWHKMLCLHPVCGSTPAPHDYFVTWRSRSSVKTLCSNASLFSLCRGQNLLFSSILRVFILRSSECKGSRRWRASHYLQKGFKSLNASWGRTP